MSEIVQELELAIIAERVERYEDMAKVSYSSCCLGLPTIKSGVCVCLNRT